MLESNLQPSYSQPATLTLTSEPHSPHNGYLNSQHTGVPRVDEAGGEGALCGLPGFHGSLSALTSAAAP